MLGLGVVRNNNLSNDIQSSTEVETSAEVDLEHAERNLLHALKTQREWSELQISTAPPPPDPEVEALREKILTLTA